MPPHPLIGRGVASARAGEEGRAANLRGNDHGATSVTLKSFRPAHANAPWSQKKSWEIFQRISLHISLRKRRVSFLLQWVRELIERAKEPPSCVKNPSVPFGSTR